MTSIPKRLVVGISGASGMIYTERFLMAVPVDYEVHLIFSETGQQVMATENGWQVHQEDFRTFIEKKYGQNRQLATFIRHEAGNHYAPVASGSFKVQGMVIIPCSVKTLAGVAGGYADTLIGRAADVSLKEKRPLVLVVRETPLNQIHLKNMLSIDQAGGIILPASPGFYHKPETIEDLADFIAARILNVLHIPQSLYPGWRERLE
jgi:4-hydroxy-3-polyprenylbenzoate decarboxylase